MHLQPQQSNTLLDSLKALKGGEQMHGQLFCFLFSQYYYRIKNMISCDTKAQGYCFSIANLCCIFCHAVLGAVTFCCVISCAQVISFFQIGLLQAGSKDTAVNSSSFLTRCMFSTTLPYFLSLPLCVSYDVSVPLMIDLWKFKLKSFKLAEIVL